MYTCTVFSFCALLNLPRSMRTWGAPDPTALNLMESLVHCRLGNIFSHASRATLAEASRLCPFNKQDSSVEELENKTRPTKLHSDNAQDDVLLPDWSPWKAVSSPACECSATSTSWDFSAPSLLKTLPNTIIPFWISVVWTAAFFGSCPPRLTIFLSHKQCDGCAKQNMNMTAAITHIAARFLFICSILSTLLSKQFYK